MGENLPNTEPGGDNPLIETMANQEEMQQQTTLAGEQEQEPEAAM